jgi:hypothetical protein
VYAYFGSSGAADCEALVNILAPQFDQNKADAAFVKNMLRRLRAANCDQTDLFAQATEQLYQLEPSAEAAFNMARRALKRDETDRAKEYYQQAMDQETDKEQLAKYYYEYAVLIFAKDHKDAMSKAFDWVKTKEVWNHLWKINFAIREVEMDLINAFPFTKQK